MPSEISQTERDRYCRISLICGILKNQTHRKRDQIGGCQGWGVEEGELDEGGQKAQTSYYYKTNQSWGCNVQHGDYH